MLSPDIGAYIFCRSIFQDSLPSPDTFLTCLDLKRHFHDLDIVQLDIQNAPSSSISSLCAVFPNWLRFCFQTHHCQWFTDLVDMWRANFHSREIEILYLSRQTELEQDNSMVMCTLPQSFSKIQTHLWIAHDGLFNCDYVLERLISHSWSQRNWEVQNTLSSYIGTQYTEFFAKHISRLQTYLGLALYIILAIVIHVKCYFYNGLNGNLQKSEYIDFQSVKHLRDFPNTSNMIRQPNILLTCNVCINCYSYNIIFAFRICV